MQAMMKALRILMHVLTGTETEELSGLCGTGVHLMKKPPYMQAKLISEFQMP